MTDHNRKPNQPNRGQQPSSDDPQQTSPRQDEERNQGMGSTSRTRNRDDAGMADDRGDRQRRSFSGDREGDELGSEMEDERQRDDADDLDDDLGGTGRSNR